MNEEEFEAKEKEWHCMESRYHWIITTMLVFMGFFGGIIFQSERAVRQISINTVRIDVLERQFISIETKLDRVLEEKSKRLNYYSKVY